MQDLIYTLAEYDLELLTIIAARWDVELDARDVKIAAPQLAAAMRDPGRVADAWARLTDDQRQVLQTVAGTKTNGGRMMSTLFKRVFGEIRTMGPDRREREKPHLNPQNAAEALYYRGFIAMGFDQTPKATVAYVYVPTDLVTLLPTDKTAYDTTPQAASASDGAGKPAEYVPENIRQADTALIDDLATFLAWCNLNAVAIVDRSVTPEVQRAIKPYLLGSSSAARLALMIALTYDLGIANEENGAWHPLAPARRFLDLRRAEQVRRLADTWLKSSTYNELWYVPGLRADIGANWQNDPLAARQTVLNYLEDVPGDQWWSVDDLIAEVKEEEPNFQRPDGDYESWYVRDATTNQFLRGFESWDRVDGALLRFIIVGVMNGLGLIDTAQNGSFARLTTYGRALLNRIDWPLPKQEPPAITIDADGTLTVPRTANRFDRFQIARFTEWEPAADPYVYHLNPVGLKQALAQELPPAKILTFLENLAGDALPEGVTRLLQTWGAAGSQATLTIVPMSVLRVPSAEIMTTILNTPELRRFLGAPLGPNAAAVRTDQAGALAAAIQSVLGLNVDNDA